MFCLLQMWGIIVKKKWPSINMFPLNKQIARSWSRLYVHCETKHCFLKHWIDWWMMMTITIPLTSSVETLDPGFVSIRNKRLLFKTLNWLTNDDDDDTTYLLSGNFEWKLDFLIHVLHLTYMIKRIMNVI